MSEMAGSSRRSAGVLLMAVLGAAAAAEVPAMSHAPWCPRTSGSSSRRGLAGFAFAGGVFGGLLPSPAVRCGLAGRGEVGAGGSEGVLVSTLTRLGAGKMCSFQGRFAPPDASLPSWGRKAGALGRLAGSAVRSSTINGFFTKGFGDPDEDRGQELGDKQLEFSETEGLTVRIADCKMPTKRGMFRMRSYRHQGTKKVTRDGEQVLEWVDMEPVVLYKGIKGSPMKSNVLVRVHDQCFTSEVMGSRRCDCREQLELAMDMVQKQGGAIIYLPQEGRGIGLANKVAAYHLQDQGLDTVDANRRLGFDDDERVYGCVPFILRDLGIETVQLMTNNPFKVKQLTELGVTITSTQPAIVPPNQYNERYLRTKAQRMAHAIFNFDPVDGDADAPDEGKARKPPRRKS